MLVSLVLKQSSFRVKFRPLSCLEKIFRLMFPFYLSHEPREKPMVTFYRKLVVNSGKTFTTNKEANWSKLRFRRRLESFFRALVNMNFFPKNLNWVYISEPGHGTASEIMKNGSVIYVSAYEKAGIHQCF